MSILSAPRRWKFRESIFRLQTACMAFSIFDINIVKSLLELLLKCFMILLCISITAYIYIFSMLFTGAHKCKDYTVSLIHEEI